MNTMYKKYIDKHGNFSHNLNIEIDESLSEDEKNTEKNWSFSVDSSLFS